MSVAGGAGCATFWEERVTGLRAEFGAGLDDSPMALFLFFISFPFSFSDFLIYSNPLQIWFKQFKQTPKIF
jgi:hypothetical protein